MDEKKTNTLEESLKKLKEIGIKRISVDTHITEPNIEAILNREFDKLNPTKAIGFAKILEREYGVDLSEWKKEFKAYREQIKKEQEKIFVAVSDEEEEKEKSGKLLLIIGIVALIIIAYGTYMFLNSHSSQNTPKIPKSNISKENKLKPEIENKESKIALNSELNKGSLKEANKTESLKTIETNETNISIKEQNETQNMEKNQTIQNENNQTSLKSTHESFILSPRSRIWVGVIYLDNFKREQFLTDQNITLNPKRDFLIVTGHGKFDIFIDKEKYHYDDPLKVRLLYKDQSLEKIDANTFKTLNRGKSW